MKYLSCVELLNIDKDVFIFQRKKPGASFRSLTINAYREILVNKTGVEQAQFLYNSVYIRSIHTSICSYLDRGTGRIHNFICNRLIHSLFSSLPAEHMLSLLSCSDKNSKKDFANRLLTSCDNLTSDLWRCVEKCFLHRA